MTNTAKASFFELQDLSCVRGPNTVLHNVSLSFRSGEFVALAGLNGAGKSTLLEVMTGLLGSYTGSCTWEGKEIREWPRRELARRVSFLPQFHPANSMFSVEQVVLMGRHPHQDSWFASHSDRQAAAEAMDRAGCAEFHARAFDTLSGGERQRVLLAAVLAQQPRALVLDEPATFVDLPHQVRIYRMLASLCKQGLLCIAATHDLNLAAAYATRVVVLDRGRVAVNAAPSDAFQHARFLDIFGPDISLTHTPSGRPWLWYGD
jgi:iron complex transport system ATP-binding protein